MLLRRQLYHYSEGNDIYSICVERDTNRNACGNIIFCFEKNWDTFKINLPWFQIEELRDFFKGIDKNHNYRLIDRRIVKEKSCFAVVDIKEGFNDMPIIYLKGRDYTVRYPMYNFDANAFLTKLDDFLDYLEQNSFD